MDVKKDYDLYLEDQLNELTFKHETLSSNYTKLSKDHQQLLEQYDRLQQDLAQAKLAKVIPKSKSLGDLDKKSTDYFSSAEVSPVLNFDSYLSKIERCKFIPVKDFDQDYYLSVEMTKRVQNDLFEEQDNIYQDLLLLILATQSDSNLYHFKYAQMIKEKDLDFRKNYYRYPDNLRGQFALVSPPTLSSNQSSIRTFKANVFSAISNLGKSVHTLVKASSEEKIEY